MDDKSIIETIINNDNKKVIRELYEIASPSISDFVKSNGGNQDDANDAFQEAVVGLITAIKTGRFNDQFTIRNYLFGIARNQWYSEIKKRKSNTNTEVELIEYDTQIDKLINKEKTIVMQKLVESIGSKCSQLLQLSVFEGKKNKEISAIMGFNNEKVVKATYYRCKQKLRDKLNKKPQLLKLLKGE